MRRGRSPPPPILGNYDSRSIMNQRAEPRPPMPQDYEDSYTNPPVIPYEPASSPSSGPPPQAFIETQQHYNSMSNYRDQHRLPSTYIATMREPYPVASSPPYKILCITNINHKISDGPVKEALISDFSRFGDISVSICHDSGERLAYIYFRTYEEAREARHAKTRSKLFDRPIEIEPIYEPSQASPIETSPPPPMMPLSTSGYSRRRSITPTEFIEVNGPMSASRRPVPIPPHPDDMNSNHLSHARGISPPDYHPYPPHQYPHMTYGRHYYPPPQMPPMSPYSSPPHEAYRSYHHPLPPPPHPPHYQSSHHYATPYAAPSPASRLDRDPRSINDSHSPRHDPYYPSDHRGGYPPPPPPPPAQHASRAPVSRSSHYTHPSLSPNIHQSSSSSASYRSPPYPEQLPTRYMSREFRREKFGSEHYNSEHDDGRPSRVLLVNNIDTSKSEADLGVIFDSFGTVEDIELRKIGSDVATALVKFTSMDGAYKAKTATNGRHIGNLRCRIVYGKVSASRRLWIGGLSSDTTIASLGDECSRFGELVSVDYSSGRPYAYIEYDSANQAQFAAHHLRTTLTPAPERKIRIEFVDPEKSDKISRFDSNLQPSVDISSRSRTTNESWSTNELEPSPQSIGHKRSITPTDAITSKRVCQESNLSAGTFRQSDHHSGLTTRLNARSSSSSSLVDEKQPQGTIDKSEFNNNQQTTEILLQDDESSPDPPSPEVANLEAPSSILLAQCRTMREIIHYCSVSWPSQLALRNFNFPSRLFLCSGHKLVIEEYLSRLNGENGDSQCPILRITQRWRLHPQPKLEEVKRRMQTGNLGMLIITSRIENNQSLSPSGKTSRGSTNLNNQLESGSNDGADSNINFDKSKADNLNSTPNDGINSGQLAQANQSRPLKNLISYLEQKDAAGVISLGKSEADSGGNQEGSKLLYAFPPGDFALNLLKRKAPLLVPETMKEEFLLGVIVGSTDAKIQ